MPVFPDWDAVENSRLPFIYTATLLLYYRCFWGNPRASANRRFSTANRFISRATLRRESRWTSLDQKAGSIVWAIKLFAAINHRLIVKQNDLTTFLEGYEVETVVPHQSVRGRGGTMAVMNETHWKGHLRHSWEHAMGLQHSR